MYEEDLAYVHEAGFTQVAEAAWRELETRCRPGHLVDLGCGGGVLATLATDAGWTVTGVDISASMVEMARQRCPSGTFRVASALDPIPPCDAVSAIGEVFGYAAWQDGLQAVEKAFCGIRDALRPDGCFLFDVASPGRAPAPSHATRAGRDWEVEAEAFQEGDSLVRRITTRRTDGAHVRSRTETHHLRMLPPSWVVPALEDAGFRVESMGGYDDFAFQEGWDAYAAT